VRRVVTVKARVGADKRFLRRFLGLAAIVQHSVRQIKNWRLVGFDEFAECCLITTPGSFKPDLFFNCNVNHLLTCTPLRRIAKKVLRKLGDLANRFA
jgi:hypothetical protein